MTQTLRPRLILFPRTVAAAPVQRDRWREALYDVGFIGKRLPARDVDGFRVGANFLSCISFLGCSPALNFDETGTGTGQALNLYFIQLPQESESPVLIGDPSRPPRCPHCRAPLDDWPLSSPVPVDEPRLCAHCGSSEVLHRWNWRHQAGFGRYWIEVRGVHEGEAVPTDWLLSFLQNLTGVVWDYAYDRG